MNIDSFVVKELDCVQEAVYAGVVEGSPAILSAEVGIELIWPSIVEEPQYIDAAFASSDCERRFFKVILNVELAIQ